MLGKDINEPLMRKNVSAQPKSGNRVEEEYFDPYGSDENMGHA